MYNIEGMMWRADARRERIPVEHPAISLGQPTVYRKLTVGREAANSAVRSIGTGSDFGRLVAVVVSCIPIATLSVILTAVGNGAGIAIVGVNSA